MRKPTLLITAFLLSVFSCIAQEKITVGIISSDNAREQRMTTKAEADIISAVSDAFMKTKRFNLVDRANMAALEKEKKLQKSEDFIDGKTVEQGKGMGAQFLISVSSSNYQNDGSVCKFTLTLKVIDVATGQITNSGIIDVKGGNHGKKIAAVVGGVATARFGGMGMAAAGGAGNQDNALKKALDDVSDEIDNFVLVNFPNYFSIIEVQEKDAKGNAVKILIAGGSGSGLKKGEKLKIIELKDIDVDGKTLVRKIDVCELKVLKVEDENFSVCQAVTEENNLSSLIDAKKKLKVVTVSE